MVDFTPVDIQTWERADLFDLYTEVWSPCMMSFTVTVDVTETVKFLKGQGRKVAPAFYYLIAKAICEQPQHRMGYRDGVLGYRKYLQPFYPFLNKNKDITFHSCTWKDKYGDYEREYLEEQRRNEDCCAAVCGEIPENFILISILPFMNFQSCSFDLKKSKYYLTPTLFLGQFKEENGRMTAPLSVTFNHAVSDGHHLQIFFDRLQQLLSDPLSWCE